MRKNTANQKIAAQLVSATDGSNVTAGTTTVYLTIDAGAQASIGTATHEGQGCWSIDTGVAGNTNGDHLAFTFVNASAVSVTVNVYTISYDPHDTDDLGLTTLTGHTPQTGDSFARIGAPAGASVSADIAALPTAAVVNAQCDLAIADGLTSIADAVLNRDFSAISDTNARTLLNAARFLRNKWSVSGTTLTVTKEDDSTSAWTSTVAGDAAADPIVSSDPA